MEKRIYPEPIESVVSPEPYERRSFTNAEDAVEALKELYDAQHPVPARLFRRIGQGRRPQQALPCLLSRSRGHDLVLQPGQLAPGLWPHADAGHLLNHHHPARPVRKLSARAVAADHAQSRRAGHGGGIEDADPAAFRLPRRHPCRRVDRRPHQAADPRPVRRAGPRRHRRPHRQRHVRGAARRGPAAGALHGAAHRLFAAPAVALHRHQPAPFPELRAVHQLPVLHRRVLPLCPRPDGQGRRRLQLLRRAGQRRHDGRRSRAGRRRRRRRACRRCPPIT